MTDAASPAMLGDVPAVNIIALAPALGIRTRVTGQTLVLVNPVNPVNPTSVEWRGVAGGQVLASSARNLFLAAPIRIMGAAVYLPADSLAEIVSRRVRVDRSLGRIEIAGMSGSSFSEVAGWEAFTVEKTPEEITTDRLPTASEPLQRVRIPVANLPSPRTKLNLGFGVSRAVGGGLLSVLSAEGKSHGMDVGFGLSLASVGTGYRPLMARLSLTDMELGRALEIGDMYSDLGGVARGLRYSWRRGGESWSGLSLYLSGSSPTIRRAMLTYRDEMKVARGAIAGGEVGSDGSLFAKAQVSMGRLSLFAFGRDMARLERSAGMFLSADLPFGWSVYGSLSRASVLGERSDLDTIGLRLPIRHGTDLILERNTSSTSYGSNVSYSTGLTMPLGPLRTFLRYNHITSGIALPDALGGGRTIYGRHLMLSASYPGNHRLSLDYQANLSWHAGAPTAAQEQVVGRYRLSRRTEVQAVSAFPNLTEPDRLQLRLSHQLRDGLAMAVDYGSALTPGPEAAKSLDQRLMLTVNTQWDVDTPARGGRVYGTVRDQAGRPVPRAEVTLNNYRAVADAEGRYQIEHIPSGPYQIGIDPESLSVESKPASAPPPMLIGPRTAQKIDLQVIPLNSISGRVILDRSNGAGDAGAQGAWSAGTLANAGVLARAGSASTAGSVPNAESAVGFGNAVLLLDGKATASSPDGSFAFHNLEPGEFTVRLAQERLPEGLVLVSPAEVRGRLEPNGAAPAIVFRLARREKRVIFQNVP